MKCRLAGRVDANEVDAVRGAQRNFEARRFGSTGPMQNLPSTRLRNTASIEEHDLHALFGSVSIFSTMT
jgi:hypothetical protein